MITSPAMRYALSPRITLIYLLIVSVAADIVYGVLDFYGAGSLRLSLLYRMTILSAFIVVLLRRNDLHAWIVKGMFVLWLISLSVWLYTYGKVPLWIDLNFFLRIMFVMAIAFLAYRALECAYEEGKDLRELLFSGIVIYGIVASCSIVFSFVTGIGRLTYGEWAFGIKSFFTGGNDIGLTMLVALVFCWRSFWISDSLWNLFKIILVSVAIALIGSRAAFGGVIGVTGIFTLCFLLFRPSRSMKTSVYKVVVATMVIGISSFTFKYVNDNFDELAYQVEKVTELLDGLSPRAKLEEAGAEVLEQRAPIHDAFGQGATFFFEVYDLYFLRYPMKQSTDVLPYKAVEQDLMDIYGMYGWLLGSVIILYHLYFWLLSVRCFVAQRDVLNFSCLLAITMYLFHGFLAGHALATSQVSTVIGVIYAFLWFNKVYLPKESVN